MSLVLLDEWNVERMCGGKVELFHHTEDPGPSYRLLYTSPAGKQYAAVLLREDTARAVAKNWARGQTDVPWAHLVDGEVWMD